MKISARNQLPGKIVKITTGMVNSEVVIELADGLQVTSVITKASAKNLGLKKGRPVYAVVKSSDVLIAVPCNNPNCTCSDS